MEAPEDPELDHFIGYLGLDLWHEDDRTFGRATITPEMWVPGTQRVRLGILFTMADVVGGSPPNGILTPTIELRMRLLSDAPHEGEVRLEGRPMKAGKRIYTGEVLCYGPELFAVCEYSFMNQSLPHSPEHRIVRQHRPLPGASFDDVFQMRMLEGGAVEMDPHGAVRNGLVGTIQGGAQATMVEVAAERALAGEGPYAVRDLHVRYLNAVKVGPALARPQVFFGDGSAPVVRVAVSDVGAGDRIVSSAVAVCRRA
ncbi:MAG TPA: hypothetical protein VFH58_06275 [Acidimicrobiales bacterium]|nr:hypothetical protein [Acidimicrobiales bacterium]